MFRILCLITTLISLWGAPSLAAELPATANPKVAITTSMGTFEVELFPQQAPNSVENFLRYVDEGFYSDTIFHRVISNFMIQGGGFTSSYQQKSTHKPVTNEADNGLKNTIGTLAMARTSDPHSATSQFFVNVTDNDFLDFREKTPRAWGYAVFGRVTKGMNIIQQIKQVPTGAGGPFRTDAPKTQVVIQSATRIN